MKITGIIKYKLFIKTIISKIKKKFCQHKIAVLNKIQTVSSLIKSKIFLQFSTIVNIFKLKLFAYVNLFTKHYSKY